jgi:hypothetical protein
VISDASASTNATINQRRRRLDGLACVGSIGATLRKDSARTTSALLGIG